MMMQPRFLLEVERRVGWEREREGREEEKKRDAKKRRAHEIVERL